jgi:uncharacterized protein YndB with AHSA1/START domain
MEVAMKEITAEAAVDINAPRSEVWRSLTDPEKIKEYYLGAEVQTDWRVGSPITFKGEWDGNAYEDKGEILEAESERKLTYSHYSPRGGKPDTPENYHVVAITLDDQNGGTHVTLHQSNLRGGATDEDRANREDYEKNWKQMLDGLKKTTER